MFTTSDGGGAPYVGSLQVAIGAETPTGKMPMDTTPTELPSEALK